MNWRLKYSFWRDPVVDGFVYRYKGDAAAPRIDRSPLPPHDTLEQRRNFHTACRWETHVEFDPSDEGEAACKKEWRRLCDLAGPDEDFSQKITEEGATP